MRKLNNIVYKGFTFPNNPETTGYKCDRSYIKHKYPGIAGNELEDFSANAVIITGSGYFFGDKAYSNFRKLEKEFKKNGVGKVSHPVYTSVTRGLMVSLESTIEAEVNAIRYSFEIVADTTPSKSESKKKKSSVTVKSNKKKTGNINPKVGDIVYFKGGIHYVTSYKDSKGYKATAGKARVTIIKKGHAHPYHLIHINNKSNVYGWVNADTIQGLTNSSSSSSGGKGKKVVHVVKKGECLSKICASYSKKFNTTISWRTIAKKNKISNPNLIYPGQKITIYY